LIGKEKHTPHTKKHPQKTTKTTHCMQLYTFQARSLRDALRLVREELGPDASVLHTREIGSPLARWFGYRQIEVTASDVIAAPKRLAPPPADHSDVPAAELDDYRGQIRAELAAQ
jgi:hypothetical protein